MTGLGLAALLATSAAVQAAPTPLFTEGFDGGLPATWTYVNNSTAGGSTNWFQPDGVTSFAPFPAQAGATNSYAASNFNAAGFGGDISNWMITPSMTIDNGYTFSFYARTDTTGVVDNLELRLSTTGTGVGTTTTSLGDFTTLLVAVNPTLDPDGFPDAWTQFTATITGLSGPTTAYFGFRYVVSDTSVNGNYVGVDTVSLVGAAAAVPEPESVLLFAIGLSAMGLGLRRRASR